MPLAQLKYRGTDLLSGQALPLLGKDVEYIRAGERYVEGESWRLEGFLTGCDADDLFYERALLLSGFSNCFGQLEIAGLTFPAVEIKTVSFDDSQIIGYCPYSISFLDYTTFQTHSGVLDPSDELNYQERQDGTVSLRRSIRARGVNISGASGMANAIVFVNNRLDTSIVTPFTISGARNLTQSDFYLVSSQQTVDKLNGLVSAEQEFVCDPSGVSLSKNIVHRYVTEISEDMIESEISVSVNGTIKAGTYFTGDLSDLVIIYSGFKDQFPRQFIESEEVNDDRYTNSLSYSFSFPSGSGTGFFYNIPDVMDDFTVSFREGSDSALIDVSVQGNVSSRFGCYEDRLTKVLAMSGNANHFDLVSELYDDFNPSAPALVNLNPVPLSNDTAIDNQGPSLSYSLSYNDRFVPSEVSGALSFNCSVSSELPIDIYFIKEQYEGGQFIKQKANVVSRERVQIDCNADGSTGSLSGYGRNALVAFSDGTEPAAIGNASVSISEEEVSSSYSEGRSVKATGRFIP